MAEQPVDIIVVPSISDPRNTLTSIAAFQNAFNIAPPMPVVVIYGTRPLQWPKAPGRPRAQKQPPPQIDRLDESCRDRFKDISQFNGIPVYFFDQETQYRLWQSLHDRVLQGGIPLRGKATAESLEKALDGIFGATYSYGAQRNKAFIVANNLAARFVFFFDDDTYLAPHVGNMIERHSRLLERENVFAVTGGYFGQRAFNATVFRRIDEQQEFMGLLGYEIPDDQSTQDLWGWRMADGVLGGNFCTKQLVYKRICCPSMHRTPTTDDKLIGREIRRLFGRRSHVYKTGWPVIHIHFPDRMKPGQVESYLESWAKTKAFWVLYDAADGTRLGFGCDPKDEIRGRPEAKDAVVTFGEALQALAEREERIARGKLAKAIHRAATRMVQGADGIVETVLREMEDFERLKLCWPTILEATSKMRIWRRGRNRF